MSDLKRLLGMRIKELRNQRNLTQENLAEKIGIEQVSLSNIERGKAYPSAETLVKLADSLEVEPYRLYTTDALKPVKDLREELFKVLEEDEKLARLLYRFYLSIR